MSVHKSLPPSFSQLCTSYIINGTSPLWNGFLELDFWVIVNALSEELGRFHIHLQWSTCLVPPKPHQQIQGQTIVLCHSYIEEMYFRCGLDLISLMKSKAENFCLNLLKCHCISESVNHPGVTFAQFFTGLLVFFNTISKSFVKFREIIPSFVIQTVHVIPSFSFAWNIT